MAMEHHEHAANSAETIAGMQSFIQQLKTNHQSLDIKYQALLRYVLIIIGLLLFY